MKLTPILAAVALASPAAANAQSLHDTHKLHFHPAGKTPSSTWVPRATPACVDRTDGEQRTRAKPRCETAARAPATPAAAN